jgi:hypothetical protein
MTTVVIIGPLELVATTAGEMRGLELVGVQGSDQATRSVIWEPVAADSVAVHPRWQLRLRVDPEPRARRRWR